VGITVDELLSGYRVLDLCDEKGALCGKILGDMGADVIRVEKPGGDTSRNIGPFWKGTPHREKSLYWFAYNNNKRGITLNIESLQGKGIFRKLVEKADVVLESFEPSYMKKLGLGYSALKRVNPKIIMTSITPFGQEGPYKKYKATDMVVDALGGLMNVCGDPDRPPVQITQPQSYVAASTYAAEGTMIALYERGNSGLGQHVDVSAQATVTWFISEIIPFWTFQRQDIKRAGPCMTRTGGLRVPAIFACKDGYIGYLIQAGQPGAERNKAMAKWLDDEGFGTEYTRTKDWYQFDWGKMIPQELENLVQPLNRLFTSHTKQELFDEAIRRVISLFPVRTSKEIVESVQLESRKFWAPLYHESLDATIVYPGPFSILSETPLKLKQRAPTIGEHNRQIFVDELGFKPKELVALQGKGVI
jgi:crotonobetainyl-CoA:carnitine CoA-transferase CaiB-like acyl-CoA transferase